MKNSTPPAPKGISDKSKVVWKQILSDFDLDTAGLLLLTEAVRAHSRAIEAGEILTKDGLIQVDRFGQKKLHPASIAERDARGQFARLLAELGLGLSDVEGKQ